MRIKPLGILKRVNLNLRISSHLAEIFKGSMFPGLDVEEKSLGISQSALLLLDTLLIVLILHFL